MPRLIGSPAALSDVLRLYRFLALKNADVAQRAVRAIQASVKILGRELGRGHPAQDMEPEYREWMIEFGDSGYVALYRYDGRTAVILAVRHQRELDY